MYWYWLKKAILSIPSYPFAFLNKVSVLVELVWCQCLVQGYISQMDT